MENVSAERIYKKWLVADMQFIIGVKRTTFRRDIFGHYMILVGTISEIFGKPVAQLMEFKQLEIDCSVNNLSANL